MSYLTSHNWKRNSNRTSLSWSLKLVSSKGFTLIEILLVFSIVAILSVATIFAYNTFNTKQQLNNAAQDIVVMLHTAKARAQSQTASSTCSSLQSYQVMRCAVGPVCKTAGATETMFELQAVCNNGSYALDAKTLPPGVTFDSSSTTLISFKVLTGGVSPGSFIVKNGTNTRTITVSSYGQITLTGN